jgi:hypothetical protein
MAADAVPQGSTFVDLAIDKVDKRRSIRKLSTDSTWREVMMNAAREQGTYDTGFLASGESS